MRRPFYAKQAEPQAGRRTILNFKPSLFPPRLKLIAKSPAMR
jgi:hypothetical protein